MIWDVMIIGGGPAGLTAAIYAARAGLKTVLFEMAFAGGQASTTNVLENYPGFPEGEGGPELMMRFEEQARRFGCDIRYQGVDALELSGEIKIAYAGNEKFEAKTAILAMGAHRRKLGVPGEDLFAGRGVSYCATCDGALYRGKRVAVVGGGNTAIEDALYLSRESEVTLIHRRDELRARGHMVERLKSKKNVRFQLNDEVLKIDKAETGLLLTMKRSNPINVDGLFIAAGTEPNAELLNGQVQQNESGYVMAGEDTKTSLPGVFCAGDLRFKPLRQVITAASDGAVAAHMAQIYIDENP